MKLIDNWRKAHRMASVQFATLAAYAETMNEVLPTVSDIFPHYMWLSWLTAGCAITAAIARVIQQPKLKNDS